MAPSRTVGPGKSVRDELAVRGRNGVLMPRDFLAKLGDDGAGIELADFASKRVPEGLGRLHELLELDALLRAERGLAEKVVVREGVAGFDSCRGVDCLALAGRLDFSGAQQRQHEQANDFEVPTERFLRELVREEPAAGGVPVVGAFLDPRQHLCQGTAFNAKDGLPLFVAQEPEAAKHRREALKVLGGKQRIDALLHVGWPRRGFLEAVEYLRKHVAQDVRRALAHVDSPVVRAAVIATEANAARQAGGLHEPAQFILVPPLPNFLFADESGFVRRLGLALLPCQHLLRAEELDGLAVYGVVERHSPKHTLALLLTAGPQFRSECLEGRAIFGEMDVKHHVAIDDLATMDGEARLEGLGVEERVATAAAARTRPAPRSRSDAHRPASG